MITDEKIKLFLKKSAAARPRGECLDQELLAALAENGLENADPETLAHLARCPLCLETLRLARTIMEEEQKDLESFRVPLHALERARKLDPAARPVLEVVISFIKGAARVLSLNQEAQASTSAALEPVRGLGKVVSETLVTFSREFPPYLAEVDVEKTRPQTCEITVKVINKQTRTPAQGIRASLFKNGNEMESVMLHRGSAVFENLTFGVYRIELTKAGDPVGSITLETKGE